MNNIFATSSTSGREAAPALPSTSEVPYVPQSRQARFSVRENGRVLLVGGGLVVILLMFAFSGIAHRQPAGHSSQKGFGASANANASPEMSLTPILEIGPSPDAGRTSAATSADQILRPAKEKPRPAYSSTLATVPPIEVKSWQPPPYSADSHYEPAAVPNRISGAVPDKSPSSGTQDSLIFAAKAIPTVKRTPAHPSPGGSPPVRLTAGTRLRARLESEINSAVKSPVVAIIEDNYEQDGVVAVPGGSRAIGRLVNADRSGYLEVHFDSLDLPFGSSLYLDAIATDLQLRPLRGRVRGNGTGRNLLVRSAAGIGEVAATLIGRGSFNRPLSEEDMLRGRVSNNIGQAGDQQLAAMALSQRFVVNLAAGAEVYLVIEKGSDDRIAMSDSQNGIVDQHNLDELRQLLQLQRELNLASRAQ